MPNIVKNTTFPNLLDLLAPHSCRSCNRIGKPFCDRCKNYIILEHENYCPNCKSLNPTGNCKNCPLLPPTFVVAKRGTIIGDLIHDLKYNSVRALAKPLAELLDETLPVIDGKVKIVPLPTINKHIRSRGLDHTYLISKHLAKLRGKNYSVEKLLLRKTSSVQVGSDKETRKAQAKTAYTLNEKIKINETATYLLFDDVWTTGASMTAALKLLRSAGVKKIILSALAMSTLDTKN